MTRNLLIELPVPFSDTGIIFAARNPLFRPSLPSFRRKPESRILRSNGNPLLRGETAVHHQLRAGDVRCFAVASRVSELAEPPAMATSSILPNGFVIRGL